MQHAAADVVSPPASADVVSSTLLHLEGGFVFARKKKVAW
jgi:hypothetical protein